MASINDRGNLMERAARGDLIAIRILRGIAQEFLLRRAEGFPTLAAPDVGLRTAVCVCTAMRLTMLRDSLKSISLQLVPRGADVHVVVVDNEAKPNNHDLVRDFSTRCPFPVHYVHEPRRSIALARNAALEKCRDIGVDWIAFTHDDCWVSPTWLLCLLDTALRHRADVVFGRRKFLFPLPLPVWSMSAECGANWDSVTTHNVLLAGWLIGHRDAEHKMCFDERLAYGEDTDFFFRAAHRGARFVYSADPAVFEGVSPEEATLTSQARRIYRDAAGRSYFRRRYRGVTRAAATLGGRCLFRVPLAVTRLVLAPFAWPFSKATFRDRITKGTADLVDAAGATAGLFGFSGNPYRKDRRAR